MAVSPDREAFTITYSKYTSEMAGERERNCQLSMVVNVPGGFTYAVASADYRGFADLADGTKGILYGTYYFGGEKGTAYTQHDLVGPTPTTGSSPTRWITSTRCGTPVEPSGTEREHPTAGQREGRDRAATSP